MPTVDYYQTSEGVVPVAEWLEGLADAKTKARILTRIGRAEQGNFGDFKALGDGISEMRIDFGPGYRIYYSQVEGKVVLLVEGGDKKSQKADIKRAKEYLADYKSRKK
jgi:putative addiction module killer protein